MINPINSNGISKLTTTAHIPPSVSSLRLELPPFETMQSFDEYQQLYPYKESFFKYQSVESYGIDQTTPISILVEENIYTSNVQDSLDLYIADISEESYSVLTLELLSGGNPEDVRDWVRDEYLKGSKGIFFIGDIPAAWSEISGETFPCDLFYMDIDGSWTDKNNDGIYDSHSAGSGDMAPELYVSRLFASSLDYDTEETLIIDYFNKLHKFYQGDLVVPWRGLEYIEEDWYSMDVSLDMIFNDNISHFDYGYFTTGSDYLHQLSKGHHFTTVCAHSYPGGHHFGKRPTESVTYAHLYVYSSLNRDAKVLIGSDDGIIAWLNGEEILRYDYYRGWKADQHEVDIFLNQGWNRFLCKISQESGDHQLSIRFTNTNYKSISDLKYQINDPSTHSNEAEYIRSWLVNGFHQDSPDSFYEYLNTNYLGTPEKNVIPTEGETMGGKTWAELDTSSPYIDLDEYSEGADYGTSYAFVTILADQPKDAELWIGCDDGIKAWLNGEMIIQDNRYGEYISDMIKTPIRLHAGENHLLLKISEWMGSHGFSARICSTSGDQINGLQYSPHSEPISYIGKWLIAGPFANDNAHLRLTTSYIENESIVTPSIGDPASTSSWKRAIGKGRPFDINSFFDHGDWVYSEDIQAVDPPVLFYNLFACSAGKFTEQNYLSGSYVLNTSYGLVSISSSKSGSMLYFHDFSKPLSQGKSIGESFIEWFSTQAPFVQWEKEWYYGMTLCGDPTLAIQQSDSPRLSFEITSPTNGLYINDKKILPFFAPVVFGDALIEIEVINPGYGIDKIVFSNDESILFTDEEAPFVFQFNQTEFGKQIINIEVIDLNDMRKEEQVIFWNYF